MAVLWPTYYFSSASTANYYLRSSIRNIQIGHVLWVPFIVIVTTTVFVFYAVYLFFRNYIVYRQAYLKSPSTFQSLNKIETYSGRLRSYDQCLKFFDVLNRTVVVTGVSSTYSTERIRAIFEDMRLGDIQSVFIAKDRSLIIQRLKRVNNIHEKLENLYNRLFLNLMEEAKKVKPDLVETDLAELSDDSLSNRQIKALLDLVNSPDFYPEIREKFTTKEDEKVDAIDYFAEKLDLAQEEMNEIVRHYIHETDSSICSPVPFSPTNSFVEDAEQYDAHTGLISFRTIGKVAQNVNDVKLTLWGTSHSAIIIFNDWKSATIAAQALLSARPFSMSVEPAPMVTEVDWDNLYMPRADRSLRNVLGDLLYVIINIFFSIFVAMFASLLDLEVLESLLPFLGPLLKRFPKVRELIVGILGPLALNIIFAIIPYLLLVLTYYQAYIDKAKVQLSIMNKYSWLLFIQTFIVVLAGPVQDIFKAVIKQDYGRLLAKLDKKAANTSAIFLNLTLQKALIGLIIVITKPADIFLAFAKRIWDRQMTPRTRRELNKPSSLPLGFLYPEYAVIVFQICVSFIFITPLISFAGILFFALAYVIFRSQLIFSDKIPHETGGIFWPSMSTHILFALVMAQFFTLIQFVSLKGRVQAFLLAPVLVFTVIGMIVIRRRFSRRVNHIALSGEAQEASLRLIQAQTLLRDQVIDRNFIEPSKIGSPGLQTLDEETQESTRAYDTYNTEQDEESGEPNKLNLEQHLDDRLSSTSQAELMNNPYTNPVILKRLRTLMLPLHFFSLMRWLKDHPLKP